jgi:hypothetical protein
MYPYKHGEKNTGDQIMLYAVHKEEFLGQDELGACTPAH